MKYNIRITALLILFFLISQLVGLGLVNASILGVEIVEGVPTLVHEETVVERPPTRGAGSLLYLALGIAIATAVILLLVRFRLYRVWKLWFFLAVWLTITISLGVFLNGYIAAAFAFVLGLHKLLKPNLVTHNLTEVLIYSGLAILFVPIFDLFWISMLLIAISVYDMIAVWRTRHMVKMALFLTESRAFAGLVIPLAKKRKVSVRVGKETVEQEQGAAILGGGDVAFPLLFTGVIMEELIRTGANKVMAFLMVLPVTALVTLGLLALFMFARKDRFYPAMPFITLSCFIGFGILILLGLF